MPNALYKILCPKCLAISDSRTFAGIELLLQDMESNVAARYKAETQDLQKRLDESNAEVKKLQERLERVRGDADTQSW